MIEWLCSYYSITEKVFRMFGIDTKAKKWCFLTIINELDAEVIQLTGTEVYQQVKRMTTDEAILYFEKLRYINDSKAMQDFCEAVLHLLEEVGE